MTWCIGIIKIRTTNILCLWSSIVCVTRSEEKKHERNEDGQKKCQFNPLICDSLIFINGTLKLDPKGTHCTLPKKKKFCEERSNSRIQFVSNILKLVLEMLDLGPSSKMTLRIEGSDWKVTRKGGNYLGVKLGIVLRQIEDYTKFPIYQFLEISSYWN
jgi:hypothetical protein